MKCLRAALEPDLERLPVLRSRTLGRVASRCTFTDESLCFCLVLRHTELPRAHLEIPIQCISSYSCRYSLIGNHMEWTQYLIIFSYHFYFIRRQGRFMNVSTVCVTHLSPLSIGQAKSYERVKTFPNDPPLLHVSPEMNSTVVRRLLVLILKICWKIADEACSALHTCIGSKHDQDEVPLSRLRKHRTGPGRRNLQGLERKFIV